MRPQLRLFLHALALFRFGHLDEAAFKDLLGKPLGDLRRDEFQRPELWERLFTICAQRGIEPATTYPWEESD
ncbi:MAG: hypothetical protein KJ072_26795 [Verrucomicrobia bacterium]|nr:hypothetical protein [Verrucomicrobiota bacterium]